MNQSAHRKSRSLPVLLLLSVLVVVVVVIVIRIGASVVVIAVVDVFGTRSRTQTVIINAIKLSTAIIPRAIVNDNGHFFLLLAVFASGSLQTNAHHIVTK
jgi:hypothetical protein